ncbi:MAG: ABC transporter ATP-binding protein [Acetobacteraceae bacterium]
MAPDKELVAPLLEVTRLRAGYAGQQIVRGVGLEVRRGEIVAVIGPNGAGKSTLLHTLAGLLKPYAGRVILAGREITGIDPERTLAAGLAYVPQVGNIFPSLSVFETLEVCCQRPDFGPALDEVLQLFPRLGVLARRTAGLLSGGERQMLAIARALINRPFDLLMADEPSAGLSANNVRAIFDRVEQVRQGGISVLLVEQNAARALAICDRAYVMEAGRVVLEDEGRALLNSPAVQRHYLGIRS